MNLVSFIQSVRAELVYVKWPTRGMVIASTFAVMFISVITAAYLGGLDVVLRKLVSIIAA